VKILAISDRVVKHIYSEQIRTQFADIDLVFACGDLPFNYLEYSVTMLNVPLYYVLGNHCPPVRGSYLPGQLKDPPGGGVNLDGRVVNHRGLVVAGLEGSIRYNQRPYHQYTQGEMWRKVLGLVPMLLMQRVRHGRFLDVLVTHSPPFGIQDDTDQAHQGFRAFLWVMRAFKPQYLIHGHQHVYDTRTQTETRHHDTWVVNAYGYKVLQVEPGAETPQEPNLISPGRLQARAS
jgi:Icc-related predicted phosphoesterase